MVAEKRKNLLRDWCPEGISVMAGAVSRSPEDHTLREQNLQNGKGDDKRAASFLHAITGLVPRLEDTGKPQGRVDLSLHGPGGRIEIVEITATTESAHRWMADKMEKAVREVEAHYQGRSAWGLSFGDGWTAPLSPKATSRWASEVAQELERLGNDVAQGTGSAIAADLTAYVAPDRPNGTVYLASRSSGVWPSAELPYLERLSIYLKDDHVSRKTTKLEAERARVGSSRQHLYLLMDSTGESGGLLPVSPTLFTDGLTVAPEPLTDLWLDGGTGEIYHWTSESGWVFHRTI